MGRLSTKSTMSNKFCGSYSKRSYKVKSVIYLKFSLTRCRSERYRYEPVCETAKRYANFRLIVSTVIGSVQRFRHSQQVEIWRINKRCKGAHRAIDAES